jgi:hypothetical protein
MLFFLDKRMSLPTYATTIGASDLLPSRNMRQSFPKKYSDIFGHLKYENAKMHVPKPYQIL